MKRLILLSDNLAGLCLQYSFPLALIATLRWELGFFAAIWGVFCHWLVCVKSYGALCAICAAGLLLGFLGLAQTSSEFEALTLLFLGPPFVLGMGLFMHWIGETYS